MYKKFLVILGLMAIHSVAMATEQKISSKNVLPQPLTLESLLALPATASPQVLLQKAQWRSKQSDYQIQTAKNSVQLGVQARLGWREYVQTTQDNHRLALHLGKKLYDFGQTTSTILGAKYGAEAEKTLIKYQRDKFKLALMQDFFNVILADLQYRVDNENMAVVYVGLDKIKDRHALHQISDIEYAKKMSDYQRVLVQRTQSAYARRAARIRLMNLVGQPNNLPDKLAFPSLKQYQKRKLKPLAFYQTQVLSENIELAALKLKLQSAHQGVEFASAGAMPKIRLDAWAGKLSSYERSREGRWRVDLSLDYPFYDGGNIKATQSKAQAQTQIIASKIKALKERLRDQVAQVYFQLKMAKAERKQTQSFENYTDLYLDLSRGLYENESKTDLGDAMVRVSQSNLETVKQQFSEALNWAQLETLMGDFND